MQAEDFNGLRDDVEFTTDMLIMTCASSRITFTQGVEVLEERLADMDDNVRDTARNILRQALDSQIVLFQEMFDRIDKSTGRRLM